MIDEAQLISAVRQVAATQPDRIYVQGDSLLCNYLPNKNNPCGCIIGESLLLCGIDREILSESDALVASHESSGTYWGAQDLSEILSGLVTSRALSSRWLRIAQARQDRGLSWGEAVRAADLATGRVDD
jgi:hypothetical protein